MGEVVVKEGLLLKEEIGEVKWKKRWVVLRECDSIGTLCYYKVDDYINQCTPIDSFTICESSLYEYLAKPFAFELVWPPDMATLQPADHLRFQATNVEEQRSWIDALRPFTMPVEKDDANEEPVIPLLFINNDSKLTPRSNNTPRSSTSGTCTPRSYTSSISTPRLLSDKSMTPRSNTSGSGTSTPRSDITTPRDKPTTPRSNASGTGSGTSTPRSSTNSRPTTPRLALEKLPTPRPTDKPTTPRPATDTATKTAVVRKLRDFGDDEVVLMDLFPDISVDIILDALDFCNGDRTTAIQLLANQTRLTTDEDSDDEFDASDDSDISWVDDSYISRSFVNKEHETIIPEKRGSASMQLLRNKELVQTPFKRSASWHKAGPSNSNKPQGLFDFAIMKHLFRKSAEPLSGSSEAVPTGDSSQVASQPPLVINIVGAVLNGSYMEYVLEVITPQARWLVYRRYSNFFAFHKRLCKLRLLNPSQHALPPKGIKGDTSEGLVKRRTSGLGKYLNSLLESGLSSILLSNPIGKMFIDPSISSLLYNKQLEIC